MEQPTIKKNFLKILNEDIYIYGIDVDVDVDVDIVAAKLTLQHPVEFPKKPVCYGDNLYAKHPISSSKVNDFLILSIFASKGQDTLV